MVALIKAIGGEGGLMGITVLFGTLGVVVVVVVGVVVVVVAWALAWA